MSKRQFQGIYAPYIEQFIAMKRNIGYKYVTEEHYFHRFDKFTIEQDEKQIGISKELAEKWCNRWNNEADSSRYHRCICLSQFSAYLCNFGIRSYIPRIIRKQSSFIPYVFSSAEMSAIFNAVDKLLIPRRIMNAAIFAMPALFRLLYGTGLRVGEALSLLNRDVNLAENYIVVNDSKNRKQRMIPISASLSSVCQGYVNYRKKLPVPQSDNCPFFISLNGSACRQDSVYKYFRKVLKHAGIPFVGNGHGPRLHDLRHTFAVHSLKNMAESCIDLYTALPTLSIYLGHQSFSSTNTYVRLTSDMYPGLIKDVDLVCLHVFPNVEKQ